MLDSQILFMYL